MDGVSGPVGRRVVVEGSSGAGKSTFAKALAARTGLPLIHLDLEYWKPGWEAPSEDEWRERQRDVLAGDAWIADGNYLDSLDLRLARADTVVLLDTPWWMRASRAFRRGLRRPAGTQMPDGCEDSLRVRVCDEWRIVAITCRTRDAETARTRAVIAQHGSHATLHVLRSKREAEELLSAVG